mmetsp:Transcript_44712/g.53726  ORF Transcript_44712/g.53726 Transcript_44712/m.53726 type:complete len:121 (+) Transcript_44712:47-409(+)
MNPALRGLDGVGAPFVDHSMGSRQHEIGIVQYKQHLVTQRYESLCHPVDLMIINVFLCHSKITLVIPNIREVDYNVRCQFFYFHRRPGTKPRITAANPVLATLFKKNDIYFSIPHPLWNQ